MSKSSRRRQYALIGYIASEAGLDREDKLDLARMVLDAPDIESLSDLDEDDLADLAFGLQCWRSIQQLRLHNGSLVVEAKVLVDKMSETAEETAERQNRDDSWN